MGLFDKLKSIISGGDEDDTTTTASTQKSKTASASVKLTDQQLSIKAWLNTLSPEWKEIMSDHYLSADMDDEELEEKFRELTNMSIDDNAKVKDITPLGELIYLKELNMSSCRVMDISPLKKLKALEELDISCNPVKDISPLGELTSLKVLRMGGSDFKMIDNIDALSGLKNLEEISLLETLITSLAPLGSCTNLKEIVAGDTQVNTLEGLENCTRLERLMMYRTPINSLTPIENAVHMKDLGLFHCQFIGDISVAANFKEMEKLDIAYTAVRDLKPLHGLSNLEELSVMQYLPEEIAAFKAACPTCKVEEYG